MIRIEGAPRDVRIIGSLKGALLRDLLEILSEGQVALDLSEARETDEATVGMLARLPAVRCSLVNCPRWLALRIEQERRPQPLAGARRPSFGSRVRPVSAPEPWSCCRSARTWAISGIDGAARTLGMARSTLESGIQQLGIDKLAFRRRSATWSPLLAANSRRRASCRRADPGRFLRVSGNPSGRALARALLNGDAGTDREEDR